MMRKGRGSQLRRRRAPALRGWLPIVLLLGASAFQDATVRVLRVVDGDTIVVERSGRAERVRYIGIDTPELSDPRPAIAEAARRAREANERLVGGRRVRLELDVEPRDRYGRLLAYVWVGDTLVNERLVRGGYARLYTSPPNVRHVERLVAAARRAREDEAPATPLPPGAIDAWDAAARIGEEATVCGTVASARYLSGSRRRLTFLNLERPYPDQALAVVIPGEARARFGEPPEVAFAGRTICVTGEIRSYRGTPEVTVRDPGRIEAFEQPGSRTGRP